jgi:hypothetical protein
MIRTLYGAVLFVIGVVAGILGSIGFLVELFTDAQWERDPLLLIVTGLVFIHLANSGDHS